MALCFLLLAINGELSPWKALNQMLGQWSSVKMAKKEERIQRRGCKVMRMR